MRLASTSTVPGPRPRPQRMAVVTPLANELDTIDEFVRRVVAQLGPDDRLFLIFDNVCKDGTVDRARALAEAEPRITVVWAPQNRCVVDAYFCGYRTAYEAGYDWILEMDGGLSHRPEEIPRFVAAMSRGYEYAGGSRFVAGGSISGPLFRRVVSQGGTILSNLLLRTRMRDMTSGFECFSRKAMGRLLAAGVRSRLHFFQTEIRYMMHGLRWTEVPITYGCPSKSVGQSSLREAFGVLWQLFRDRRRAAKERARAARGQQNHQRQQTEGTRADAIAAEAHVRRDDHPGTHAVRVAAGAGAV